MLISCDFTFSAAHYLPSYQGKCEKLHGHTYKLRVTLEGEPSEDGMIMDFAEIKKIVKEKVLFYSDHTELNKVIPNPSAENITQWIWEKLSSEFV